MVSRYVYDPCGAVHKMRMPPLTKDGAGDYVMTELEPLDNFDPFQRLHWLAKRRVKLAKVMNDGQTKARRYIKILLAFINGKEDKEFAEMAYKCLGKTLELVQEE